MSSDVEGGPTGDPLIEDLRRQVAKGQVVVVVGTGVSVGACGDQKVGGHPVSRWSGLLLHGLEHCVKIEAVLSAGEAAALKQLCLTGSTESLILTAERIVKALNKKRPGAYRRWLKDTIGQLKLERGEGIDALAALGGLLATLNYDTLLEQATGRESLTWQDRDKVEELLRDSSRAEVSVLHLHGHHDDPDSVVLGLSSYAEIAGDPHTSSVLRTFALERTLLFVGCRGTVEDPNFERLVEWASEALSESTHRHYLLCATTELEGIRAGLKATPWLYPIAFGGFEDLAPFLRGLVPDCPPPPSRAPISKRREEPLELPPRPSTLRLFGRDGQLKELEQRLRAGEDVCVVAPAGLGKTALAAEAIRAILGDDPRAGLAKSAWPDGIVLLDLYRLKGSAEAAWDQLASVFDPTSDAARSRDRAIAACRARRALVVVEGAEEMNTGQNLQDLLSVLAKESQRLVLTRKWAQDWTGRPIDLSFASLDLDAGLGLLRALTHGRVRDDMLASAFAEVHGHPLALTWLGHQMAAGEESPRALLAELNREGFAQLHEAGREKRTLRWLYGRSVSHAGDDGRTALVAAGLLAAAPFPLAAIVAVLGDDGEARARAALKTLVGHGLLRLATGQDGGAESWETTHAMVYHFARSTSVNASEALPALESWIERHLRTAIDYARITGRNTGLPDLTLIGPALLHAVALLGVDHSRDLRNLVAYLTWAFDDDLRELGSLSLRRAAAEAVVRCLDAGSVEQQGDAAWAARVVQTANTNFGDVLQDQGQLPIALEAFQASLAIGERLAAEDPSDVTAQRDVSIGHDRVGNVLQEQGDLTAASEAFRASLDIRERLAAQDPSNITAQRDLSISHEKVGNVLQDRGDLTGAFAAFRASLGIAERLVAQDASNITAQRDLSVSHNKVGGVLQEQGKLAAALEAFRASLGIRERLAVQDPSNVAAQRDLSVSHDNVGDALQEQGELAAALEAFRASLGIRQRLATQDPSSATAQRDLSVSHNKVGRVLQQQDELAAALEAFQASLGIRERLAVQDPSNATAQRDLSVSHDNVGTVLQKQGERAKALQEFRASLAIAEPLAAHDPSNVTAQVDLALSCWRVCAASVDASEKVRVLQQGLLILRELEKTSRLPPKRRPLIAMFEEELSAAQK